MDARLVRGMLLHCLLTRPCLVSVQGFNVANRYLIVLYYRPSTMNKKVWPGAGTHGACYLPWLCPAQQ